MTIVRSRKIEIERKKEKGRESNHPETRIEESLK